MLLKQTTIFSSIVKIRIYEDKIEKILFQTDREIITFNNRLHCLDETHISFQYVIDKVYKVFTDYVSLSSKYFLMLYFWRTIQLNADQIKAMIINKIR